MSEHISHVGLDVHKKSISVTLLKPETNQKMQVAVCQ